MRDRRAALSDAEGLGSIFCGGEMGTLMRAHDWSQTPLGSVEKWPQSLRTSISICLASRFPIVLYWGPEYVVLYNDAYSQILGSKHPWALGQTCRTCWAEIWDTIGPMLDGVVNTGNATWSDDMLLMLRRFGYPEECYFSFSFSPIQVENGGTGGIFTAVIETTEKVIGERRLRTLRDLAARGLEAESEQDAWEFTASTLRGNDDDVPFAILSKAVDGKLQVVGTSGIGPTHKLCEALCNPASKLFEKAIEVSRWGHSADLTDLSVLTSELPSGSWEIHPKQFLLLPIAAHGQGAPGVLLAAASPAKVLDERYRAFFDFLAQQIATTVADARAYDDKRKQAESLAELDRAKTVFFSNVSHEFRTPLTLMVGPLESMLDRAQSTSITVTRDELQLVHRNSMRLLKLVNTLLDFSRIETGRVNAFYEPTDLATFTADTASAFRSTMEQAGLQFTIACQPVPEPAYVDRDMWEKIVLNLISNAFKFTLSGGVTVRLRAIASGIELRVEDTGLGIPDAHQSKVFERFHRLEGMRGRTHEGTGIGLSLVKELVKLHSGTIRLESTVGKGSVFVVTIPRGSAHLSAEQLASQPKILKSTGVSASAYVDEALRWLPEQREHPTEAIPRFAADSVQAPHVQTTSGRILLADDNADMRGYVKRLLGDNYEVLAVSNGREALAAIRNNRPDLVLTDVMMPELDGFGLLRELRADEKTNTIPIILLSARAGEDARIEGMESGADDYMVKPFTAREMLARVGAHMAMGRLRSEAAEHERILRADAEAERERTSTILESISDSFFALDQEWRFRYVNTAAETTLNMKRDELIGREFWQVTLPVSGPDLEMQYRSAMKERVPIQLESYCVPLNRWYEIRLYPAGDGGISVFYQDVTDRKRLVKSRRLAAVGTLAGGVAHFFNNDIHTVQLTCYLLRQSLSVLGCSTFDVRKSLGFVEQIEKTTRRSSEIAGRLLRFAESEMLRPSRFDPRALLQELIPQVRLVVGEKIEVAASIDEDLPNVELDANKLKETIFVLVRNAQEAMPVGGKLTLSLRKTEIDVTRAQQLGLSPSSFVVLSVADTGPGMDDETQIHLFEPFFTTKGRAQIEGLGLASAFGFIRQSGGTITVQSTLNNGSRFDLYLPTTREDR